MKTAIVTGGRGFLGRHICKALFAQGYRVVSVDNQSTQNSIQRLSLSDIPEVYPGAGGGTIEDDPIDLSAPGASRVIRCRYGDSLSEIWHFASAASPREYKARPLETLRLGSSALDGLLSIAKDTEARLIYASSSEVYGDPTPEAVNSFRATGIPETYAGHVSPVGPRSMYDEAKRYGEALCTAYAGMGTDVRVARIHNTYGPGMAPHDGRLISSLLRAALVGGCFKIHGDGTQTRTLCYVSNLIAGLMLIRDKGDTQPYNVGGGQMIDILKLVRLVEEVFQVTLWKTHTERQDVHDPMFRKPDLSRIRSIGVFSPSVMIEMGLQRTAAWMRPRLSQ